MGKPRVNAAGGLAAMKYVFRKAHEAGGLFKLYARLASRNACKTCALGMGGLKGGMVNEAGHFPEVCKKSVQAQAADMAGALSEEFLNRTPLSILEKYTPEQLEKLGRIPFPLIAEPGDIHYRRLSWEEAFDRIADAFNRAQPGRTFFYASGRSSNEAAYLFQLVARAYGTPNVHNCSFYCHQASGVALNQIYGSGTASVVLDDLDKADLVLIAGANPASNHPRLITKLMHLRRRGGRVIIINPLKELGLVRFRIPSDWRSMLFGTQVSDLYLQPRVGADIPLFKALLKGVVEAGGLDGEFIRQHTVGWEEVEADLARTPWQVLVEQCGIPRAQIDAGVQMLLQSKRGIFAWAMGLTHHTHGVDNILALSNLAMAMGWLGRPGTGLLPIRGHSNVQGVGSVGVAPAVKQAFALKLEELYGIDVPKMPGQDTYASMVAAREGCIDAAFLLGGNLYASNPDSAWSRDALRNIPFSVTVSTKLNEGHFHGRGQTAIILPALARDEEPQPTTQESMFNYVRLSEGGKPAVAGEMRSEVDIIATLAERILPPGKFEWGRLRDHHTLRQEISKAVPGYRQADKIDQGHEFQVEGRTMHQCNFNTEDGKAHFYVTPLPDFSLAGDEFALMTLRSEGQFNSVVYEAEDLYRGNTRRDVVMMNGEDARQLGLNEGDRVTVKTETGQMAAVVSIVDIAPRSLAMYYPEANVLVGRRLDPRSKTPAFKSVAAKILVGG